MFIENIDGSWEPIPELTYDSIIITLRDVIGLDQTIAETMFYTYEWAQNIELEENLVIEIVTLDDVIYCMLNKNIFMDGESDMSIEAKRYVTNMLNLNNNSPQDLRDNFDFMKGAIIRNKHIPKDKRRISFRFASERLRGNKELAILAASRDGSALKYVSDDLKTDIDVVTTACNKYALAIKYACDEFRSDDMFTSSLFIRNKKAIKFFIS